MKFIKFGFFFVLLFSAAVTKRTTPKKYYLYGFLSKVLTDCYVPEYGPDVSRTVIRLHNKNMKILSAYIWDKASKELLMKNIRDRKYNLFIIIPGFSYDPEEKSVEKLLSAYKMRRRNYIVVLDFSAHTEVYEDIVFSYLNAAKRVPELGKILAEYISDIVEAGIVLSSIHVIGLSLGAQIGSFAGKEFRRTTGKRLTRITGLDPAGPCFDSASRDKQLNSDDADFVDIYHTNKGEVGTNHSYGTANFFPNGGGPVQPQCQDESSLFSALCSHSLAADIWVKTIYSPLSIHGKSCESWEKFKAGNCSRNINTVVGNRAGNITEGNYFFNYTYFESQKNQAPDCQGGLIWIIIPTYFMISQ